MQYISFENIIVLVNEEKRALVDPGFTSITFWGWVNVFELWKMIFCYFKPAELCQFRNLMPYSKGTWIHKLAVATSVSLTLMDNKSYYMVPVHTNHSIHSLSAQSYTGSQFTRDCH